MTRRKAPISLLRNRKATVMIERNGLSIRVDDVDADVAGLVAADLLQAIRLLRSRFPELTTELQPVGGYHPLDTPDDDYAEDGSHRAGFRS